MASGGVQKRSPGFPLAATQTATEVKDACDSAKPVLPTLLFYYTAEQRVEKKRESPFEWRRGESGPAKKRKSRTG